MAAGKADALSRLQRTTIRIGDLTCSCLIVAMFLLAGRALPLASVEPAPHAGLILEYFGNPRLERVYETDATPLTHIDGQEGGNDWAAQYNGLLTPQVGGEHTFRGEADTGVRVFVTGEKIIDA